MITLISGVVLLTYKKPEKKSATSGHPAGVALPPRSRRGARRKGGVAGEDEQDALRDIEEGEGDAEELWQIGDASDDEDDSGHPRSPRPVRHRSSSARSRGEGEQERMIGDGDDVEEGEHRESTSSDATLARPDSARGYADDDFGGWQNGKVQR